MEWNDQILKERKGMEWNGMCLMNRKEWNGIEWNGKE